MWIRTRLLQLLIGNHLKISRESSSFWVSLTTTIRFIPDFAKVAAPISNLTIQSKLIQVDCRVVMLLLTP